MGIKIEIEIEIKLKAILKYQKEVKTQAGTRTRIPKDRKMMTYIGQT